MPTHNWRYKKQQHENNTHKQRFIQYQKDSTLNSYEFSQLVSVMRSKLYPQMHKFSDTSSWYEPQRISTLRKVNALSISSGFGDRSVVGLGQSGHDLTFKGCSLTTRVPFQ